jgi:hypothetical protein
MKQGDSLKQAGRAMLPKVPLLDLKRQHSPLAAELTAAKRRRRSRGRGTRLAFPPAPTPFCWR